MKVLGNLPVVKDSNVIYPFGSAIKNETETEQGTPVVREIYNDPLMNMYKILELVGVTPTDEEDNNTNGYQLVEAIKKLPNSLNDIEQVLSLSGIVWSVPFDLAYLPNKYVCFARASEDYINSVSYAFKGTGVLELPMNSPTGFNANDELIVIIDTGAVRVYSLTKLTSLGTEIFTVMGTPISFSDLDTVYYLDEGYLTTDLPSSFNLQSALRVFASSGTLQLNDVFIDKNIIVCFCFEPSNNNYYVYDVNLNDFNDITLNQTFDNVSGDDYEVYAYMDSAGVLWLTNKGNADTGTNDYEVSKYVRSSGTFTFASTVSLDNSFVKTTNGVIVNDKLITFESGNLNSFDLLTGTKVEIMFLPNMNGQIFKLDGNVYFTSGEVAKLWTLN